MNLLPRGLDAVQEPGADQGRAGGRGGANARALAGSHCASIVFQLQTAFVTTWLKDANKEEGRGIGDRIVT